MEQAEKPELSEDLAGKHLAFELKGEVYAVPVAPIEDVIAVRDFTNIPQTVDYVQGVINLRGKVIPIIDLRGKFGMEMREYDDKTCIIVVEIEDILTGFVVDRIRQVVELTESDLSPAPSMSSRVKTQYITGMSRQDDEAIILLDVEKVMLTSELEELQEAAQNADTQ